MSMIEEKIPEDTIGIMYIHTGVEYSSAVTDKQIEYQAKAYELGYSACIMIHSHVIGDLNELSKDRKMYSSNGLGNMISFQENLDEQLGVIIVLEIEKDTKNIISVMRYNVETALYANMQKVRMANIR